jgi:hypothetical protein
MADTEVSENRSSRPTLTCRTLAIVLFFYTACVLFATYPVVLTFATRFPGCRCDPLQALWVMRWYKYCLLHGHSILQCPELQFPVGAPLGNFSPLQFQAFLYLPLSLCVENDVLCYNLIWLFNLVFTGLGSFLLIWYVLRDRLAACFGGLLAMLSGPMLLHAYGHLELITLGWVPLFFIGWLRWVDRPSVGRLLVAAGLYGLVSLSAAYFAVFAIFPAVLYALWHALQNGWHEVLPWLRRRLAWFVVFALLAGVFLSGLFAPQLWSRSHGFSLPRPKGQFFGFRAPPWSYAVPSYLHPLGRGRRVPVELYEGSGFFTVESCSYLGVASLLLLGYAGLVRARLRQAGYWWVLLIVLVILSLGPYCEINGHYVALPANWLHKHFFAFRLIRAPARFNLFAGICAALLAAAGLHHLLGRVQRPALRAGIFGSFCMLALADLALVPFYTDAFPVMPACYDFVFRRQPEASLLEVPHYGSDKCVDLSSTCAYWQSWHHGKTTAGYSGFANVIYDNLLVQTSPFAWTRLSEENYLQCPEAMSFDVVRGVRFDDYAWLYLTAHRLDYLVVHKRPPLVSEFHLDRLQTRLRSARVFEDETTAVYDRTLLLSPQRPTLLCTTGWHHRLTWQGRPICLVSRHGRLTLFNPHPDRRVKFVLECAAFRSPRLVRLVAAGKQMAQYRVTPDQLRTFTSPPLRLAEGLQDLLIESDGEDLPTRRDASVEGDRGTYSLRVAGVRLEPAACGLPSVSRARPQAAKRRR